MTIKNIILIAFIFPVILISGCVSEDVVPAYEDMSIEYLIFGRFYDFCPPADDCSEIYKLVDGKLYTKSEAVEFDINQTPLNIHFKEIENHGYNDINVLQDQFPYDLLQEINLVIGKHEFNDSGRIYLEIGLNTETRIWIIDPDINTLPVYLKSYVETIKLQLDQLSK